MGQEYLSLDAIPEASQCFHRVISMGPERQYEAYVGLANIALRHEKYKEAQILRKGTCNSTKSRTIDSFQQHNKYAFPESPQMINWIQ